MNDYNGVPRGPELDDPSSDSFRYTPKYLSRKKAKRRKDDDSQPYFSIGMARLKYMSMGTRHCLCLLAMLAVSIWSGYVAYWVMELAFVFSDRVPGSSYAKTIEILTYVGWGVCGSGFLISFGLMERLKWAAKLAGVPFILLTLFLSVVVVCDMCYWNGIVRLPGESYISVHLWLLLVVLILVGYPVYLFYKRNIDWMNDV